MNRHVSRREFLSSATAAAGAVAVPAGLTTSGGAAVRGPFRGTLCFFSKSVPQLSWQELAQSTKRAGFGGIDLTVRQGGHVAPERAAQDLPKAVAAIRAEGLKVPMITTELLTADDPTAVPILRTASRLSIPFLKPGYYRYKFIDVLRELEQAGHKFRGLVALAAKYRIQVGYHNHEQMIGAPVWDMAKIMETLDPKWAGYYFDLQHATIDGGASCWRVSANLVMPRMKMMAVKDFVWKKTGDHRWVDTDCPLGQGMCHWRFFVKMAAQAGFNGPISLHMEYEIPGVTDHEGIALSRSEDAEAMAAAKQNLDTLKSLIREAYGGMA